MQTEEITEEELPLIPEDIEIGDRLYCDNPFAMEARFGTVMRAEQDRVVLVMDDGEHVELWDNGLTPLIDKLKRWGKAFPVNQLAVGVRVSILDDDGQGKDRKKRYYGTVTEYIPREKVVITYDDEEEYDAVLTKNEKYGTTVEDRLRYWELEE